IFCRSAFSLHHGWGHAARVPGRFALLVAENQRTHVSGRLGTLLSADSFRRIQSNILAAIRSWLHGYAAALSYLSGGFGFMASAACAVDGRSFDSRHRSVDSFDLSRLVAALWTDC